MRLWSQGGALLRREVKIASAIALAIFLTACGAESRTNAQGSAPRDPLAIDKSVTLKVGEQKDIELPISPEPTYAISSATTSNVGSEINVTNSQNVKYEIIPVAQTVRPALRLVGVRGGKEAIVVQAIDGGTGQIHTLRVFATVIGQGDNDIVGGSPCSGDNCGGGDTPNPPGPPGPPGPIDPGDKPEYDPDACTGAGFYYFDDDYRDVEGKFGPDRAAYIRSLMSGNVDSLLRLYYPVATAPSSIVYTNFGRYLVNVKLQTDEVVTVEFDLQLGQHLFGQAKKHFYVQTNGYCLRGEIPSSAMTPPNKSLVWVSR